MLCGNSDRKNWKSSPLAGWGIYGSMSVPIEIERRFLVVSDGWRAAAGSPQRIRQGYLPSGEGLTMRVRRLDELAFLAIKTAKCGPSRTELEYQIPREHADFLLNTQCHHPPLEKLRYRLCFGGLSWVVDEFSGANDGLVIAEAEMDHPDQPVPLPTWVGKEITDSLWFHNSFLARHPIADWGRPRVPDSGPFHRHPAFC